MGSAGRKAKGCEAARGPRPPAIFLTQKLRCMADAMWRSKLLRVLFVQGLLAGRRRGFPCAGLVRHVTQGNLDILGVVAEGFAENGQPAHVGGLVIHGKAEVEQGLLVQVQVPDAHVGNLQPVHEGSPVVDRQHFQQPILVPVGEPPVGGEDAPHVAEVPRGGPGTHEYIVDIEADVAGPLAVDAGSLGGQLGGDSDLGDVSVHGGEIGHLVLHVTLGEPKNVRVKVVRMGEIAVVVHHADDPVRRGQAAGGIYPAAAVPPHLQIHGAGIFRRQGGVLHVDEELVRHYLADLLVAVAAGIAGYSHHAALLQLLDMGGQRAVGDVELPGQLVHVHRLLHRQPHDFQPHVGAQRLEQIQPVAQFLNMQHRPFPHFYQMSNQKPKLL